jgi:hypothetical protein
MNEWNLFLKNVTESSGKSVVGEFNQLFDTMSKVISLHNEGTFAEDTVKYKIKKGRIDLDLNSKEAVKSWIDDMINYIGKYTAEDMINEKVNKDGAYRKIIPPEGTKKFGFLATLMLMEPSGMGRGEVLVAYIVTGAKFAGGGESYDITVDKYGNKLTDKAKPDIEVVEGGKTTTFELKDYSDGKPSIRLGTHGALTRFEWWKEIEKTVKVVRDITNDLGEERVHEILEDTYSDQQLAYVWDLVASKEPYQGTRVVGSGVDAGELNLGKTATLKVFYSLMHEFFKRGGPEKEDEYDYAVLKGKKVKPVTVEIDSIKKDELSDIENIKIKASKKDMAKFKELASIKYVQDPLALQRDLDKLGEHYAKASAEGDNKGVDYFMVFVKDKLDVDKLEDFVFDGISQKAAKIISSKRRDSGRGEQYADRAFKEWQKQKDKGYSEIYHDLLIKDKEEQIQRNKEKSRQKSKTKKAKTNESYYPRLYKQA